MSDKGVSIDLQALVARVKQWLAEGKDVRLFATRQAIRDFPMIEMRDGRSIEVITSAGIIRDGVEPAAGDSEVPAPTPRTTHRPPGATAPKIIVRVAQASPHRRPRATVCRSEARNLRGAGSGL